MAPRKRSRYRVIHTKSGNIVLDRLARVWVKTDKQGYLADYGHMSKPDWTVYLQGQVKG